MSLLRRCLRLPAALLLLFLGVVWIGSALRWDRLRGRDPMTGAARRAQARWCRLLCRLLGMRVEVQGAPLAAGPVLVVANHISWLDIPCVAGQWPLLFLSKSEVRHWPMVGAIATGLGTLYIERGQRDAAAAAAELIRERLRAGQSVLFFPEGTTSVGSGLLPFRPRLFQAAIDSGAQVQPLTIEYFDHAGARSAEAPFVDDQPLLTHVLRLAGIRDIRVRMVLSEPLAAADFGRTELARRCRAEIAAHMGLEESRATLPVERAD